MSKYSAPFKLQIVSEYKKNQRGSGFRALARKYQIKGGAKAVRNWWLTWRSGGETLEALEPQMRGHRRHKLTESEEKMIVDFVTQRNDEKKSVDYKQVHKHIVRKTQKQVAYTTIKEIGKERGISWKKTTRTLSVEGKLLQIFLMSSFRCRPSLSRSSCRVPEKVSTSGQTSACVCGWKWNGC